MAFGRLASLLVDIVINTRRFQSQIGTMQSQTHTAAQKMRNSLTQIGLAASGILLVKKAFDLTYDTALKSVLAFARLEKQIIDIQKVAKFDNLNAFADAYIKLGTTIRGVSFAELGEIGAELARLGVRGNAQGFTDFLEVVAKFKATTGDLDLRQAGEGLGKLLQNFNKELTATNALSLASSINKLADDFAVTSGEIVTITQKLSGFANTIGLTTEETLGLVTLIKQTGISSEVVSSSYTRLFTLLETAPITVGQALGKTGTELEKFVNDIRIKPIDAIREFFESLSKMPVQQATGILKDLEIATARNANAFLNAANRFKDFDKTQQAALDGSREAGQLLEKYALTAGTAAAKIEQLKNNWENFLQSLQSGDGVLGGIIDKLNFIIKFQLSNNPVNPGERDPLLQTQGTPKDRLAAIQKRMAETDAALDEATGFSRHFGGMGTPQTIIFNFTQQLQELLSGGSFESARNLQEKMVKLAEEEKRLQDIIIDSALVDQKAALDAKNKKKEIRLKMADLEYQNVLETEAAFKLFNNKVPNLFEEPKVEKTIRDRFEAITKEAKALIPESMGVSSVRIHQQIDTMKEIAIQQAISLHYHKQFNEQFKEELQIRINKLSELESTRSDILGILNPGGAAGDIIDRAMRVDNLLKNMSPDFKMDGNLKDLLFKSVFADSSKGNQTQIRGLTEAYKSAITDSGQEAVDKAQLKAIRDLLEVQIENKDLQKKTIEAIKEIETGVI